MALTDDEQVKVKGHLAIAQSLNHLAWLYIEQAETALELLRNRDMDLTKEVVDEIRNPLRHAYEALHDKGLREYAAQQIVDRANKRDNETEDAASPNDQEAVVEVSAKAE